MRQTKALVKSEDALISEQSNEAAGITAFLALVGSPSSTQSTVMALNLLADAFQAAGLRHAARSLAGQVPRLGGRPVSYPEEIARYRKLVAAGWEPGAARTRIITAEPDPVRRENLARALRRIASEK